MKLVHALVDTDKATASMKSKQGHMVCVHGQVGEMTDRYDPR